MQLMIQWIGVLIAVIGLAYNGVKDYQKGEIKLPQIKKELTPIKHPIQYCLMAYDPNLNKVFYLHENGQWHDSAPEQRRYPSSSQHYQDQGQAVLANRNGTQRESFGHYIR
jgi:hypothetical protein